MPAETISACLVLVSLHPLLHDLAAQNLDGAWKKQQEFDAVRAAWLKTVQMQQQQPLPPDAMQAQQQQVAMAQQLYPDAGACFNLLFWIVLGLGLGSKFGQAQD